MKLLCLFIGIIYALFKGNAHTVPVNYYICEYETQRKVEAASLCLSLNVTPCLFSLIFRKQ